jgi:hypothetical protein
MLEHTTKIDTPKVAHLNRNRLPSDQSPMEKPHAIVAPTHSIKTSATRVKSVRTAKIDPVTGPGNKVKCDHGYQDISLLGDRVPEARREMVTDALRPRLNQK